MAIISEPDHVRPDEDKRQNRRMRYSHQGWLLILIAAIVLHSCSYRLVTDDRVELPAGISNVSIALATNRTIEAGLEDLFTQELIRRLRADGRMEIVAAGAAELRCSLDELRISPVSYNEQGRVAVESASVLARCQLVVPGSGSVAWSSGLLGAAEEYPVGDNYLSNEQAKARALGEVVKDLSESVRSLLLDAF